LKEFNVIGFKIKKEMNVKMSKDEGIITKRDILQINAILMTGFSYSYQSLAISIL